MAPVVCRAYIHHIVRCVYISRTLERIAMSDNERNEKPPELTSISILTATTDATRYTKPVLSQYRNMKVRG